MLLNIPQRVRMDSLEWSKKYDIFSISRLIERMFIEEESQLLERSRA